MPLRPFPFQLSIGTDIVHVDRIRAILLKDETKPGYLDRFLKRFLTPRERNEFNEIRQRATEDELNVRSRHLAGRWAAKEAVIKAVSWRRLGFHDVTIQRSKYGNRVFAVILDRGSTEQGSVDTGISGSEGVHTRGFLDRIESEDETKSMPSSLPSETGDAMEKHWITSLQSNASSARSSRPEDVNSLIGHDDSIDHVSGQMANISISHDGDYATAVCLAAEEPREGDVGGEAAAREPP